MMVRRFSYCNKALMHAPSTYEDALGEYVLYRDYAELEKVLRKSEAAIDGLEALVKKCQGICLSHLIPDGESANSAIIRMIAALDSPEERSATAKVEIARRGIREVLGEQDGHAELEKENAELKKENDELKRRLDIAKDELCRINNQDLGDLSSEIGKAFEGFRLRKHHDIVRALRGLHLQGICRWAMK